MDFTLSSTPKNPTIILGFPGIGLVGPIVTEFLVEHMKTTQLGTFVYDNLPATAAIHKGKLVHPMSIHYSKGHNIIVLYTILNMHDHEWDVSNAVNKLAEEVQAKELIVIDGANTIGADAKQLFCFGDEKLQALGATPLKESVITGVTGSLLLTAENVNCIFAGVEQNTPNAHAAARVVEFLDTYLGLRVDTKPLKKQAVEFEQKLSSVMQQGKQALDEKEKRRMDYLG
ncbi:MAG: PAC2 family protein [Candidatus Woesearchaeota archaeon]|nr:PAC2 family protein [Candidatus Woesearchaeota archaeon]